MPADGLQAGWGDVYRSLLSAHDPMQVSRGYQAVLMDFGSARPMPVHVSSRAQALAVQEDAEVCCEESQQGVWRCHGRAERMGLHKP